MPDTRRSYSIHLGFFSAHSSVIRALRIAVRCVTLVFLAPDQPSRAFQFSAAVYDDIKPSIVRISCGSVERTATGFLWSNHDTAVTAMHVVTGCGNITTYFEAQGISRSADVIRVLRRADLALLRIKDAPNSRVLGL